MFHHLPGPIAGSVTLLLYAANTVFWSVPLFLVALLKLAFPVHSWRRLCSSLLDVLAAQWVEINNWTMQLTRRIQWDIRGLEGLQRNQWYLVLSNHQSWSDVLVLQKIFHRRIPFLKFFIKKELIWVPLLGLAWWALDMPFMKRYSRAFLEKHPHLAGRDVEITRQACEKFKHMPVAIMNFVEGTRFSPSKRRRQQSPYAALLRPRAGGIAFVLAVMGEQLHRILDVTIVYPKGPVGFWAFVCGRIREIKVRIRSLPIDTALLGDYTGDKQFRERFQQWLNALWAEKDELIADLTG